MKTEIMKNKNSIDKRPMIVGKTFERLGNRHCLRQIWQGLYRDFIGKENVYLSNKEN